MQIRNQHAPLSHSCSQPFLNSSLDQADSAQRQLSSSLSKLNRGEEQSVMSFHEQVANSALAKLPGSLQQVEETGNVNVSGINVRIQVGATNAGGASGANRKLSLQQVRF